MLPPTILLPMEEIGYPLVAAPMQPMQWRATTKHSEMDLFHPRPCGNLQGILGIGT